MVKIRLARGGRTHKPVYTIVVADSRNARNGNFIEKVGRYNPHTAEVLSDVKVDRITDWLSKGAQLSDTVKSLLKKHGVKLA